jgi:hypothetical protein
MAKEEIILSRTQLVYHLGLGQERISVICKSIEPVAPPEGKAVGNALYYLLRDVVEAILTDMARKFKIKNGDDAVGRAEVARAVKIESDNAIKLGQYISVVDVMENQAQKAATVARGLDSVIPAVKRKHNDIPPEYLSTFGDAIAVARNNLVAVLDEQADKREGVVPKPALPQTLADAFE